MKVPKSIKQFVDIFSRLPGIGPRQAIRLAFYFVRQGKAFQQDFLKAVENFKSISICKQCFYITEDESGLCDYCSDKNRDQSIIAIVEKETDILSIENTKKFKGRYLVLGDVKKSGIMEADQKLRLQALKSWIKKELDGKAKEIIVAVNPTTEGDIISALIAEEMKPFAEKVSALGRGIPTGGEIEFADEDTLGSAIERRG